ncbi:DUF58 domain-containing protein [Oceanirhabdus sp. W0125-5]|uniref:DUF58 domain-containing protein n=1 Tax=Oceanirhabdus sp. W0125-5 TaxID=2999116 RepID=UPI0022F34330|nr:DUF58 domain-containing protein [Oceanirhabdus sp. W0125-5]WBW97190.1 DUF58 domain-containing protein [Oceanirhabdus sp. W0125-5]
MKAIITLIIMGLIFIFPFFVFSSGAIIIKMLFLFIMSIIVFKIGHLTILKGFEDLEVRRRIKNNKIFCGEEIEYEMIIENKKKFPIIFLLIQELLPKELKIINHERFKETFGCVRVIHNYAIYGYERIKRKKNIRIDQRGTYIYEDMEVVIGDFFGLFNKSQNIQDAQEILVYPRIKELNSFRIKSMNVLGDNIVKRWIHNDPLYIKSIREYSGRDRMKDIHWKSSLKMNKLMAKEYDYTSDKEVMIIANIQSHEQFYMKISKEIFERTISLSVSLADKCLKEGVAVGMWTNANIKSLVDGTIQEVSPSLNSMEKILELGARMENIPVGNFSKLLMRKRNQFNTNSIYVVVTPFLDEESISILKKLSRRGIIFKIIDVSDDLNLPSVQGIEKLECTGEVE